MPSTYTLNNGIELIGTGEQSGTWGDTTNTNLELLDTALDGQVTITASSAGSSGSPNSLPITDGSASNGRNRLINITSGSDLGGTVFYQLTPNDAEKIVYIRNSLNTQDLIVFQGTYNSSNDYLIPNGTTAVVFFNGAGSGAVAANVFNNAHFDALNVESAASTTAITIDNTATDGDPILGFALSGTNTFTMGVDDGDSDKFKIGTTAIGTNTRLSIDSSGDVEIPSGSLTITSANALTLRNDTATDADEPKITFDNDTFAGANYANIRTGNGGLLLKIESPSTSTFQNRHQLVFNGGSGDDFQYNLSTDNGSNYVNYFKIDGGNVVFNETGADKDFRVESDGNTHMLFVDAGADHVNIGSSTDRGGLLNVDGTTKGVVVRTTNSAAMELIYADNGAGVGPYLYLNRPSSGPAASDQLGQIVIQGKNSADEVIDYVRLVNQLQDPTNGSEQGRFAINTMTSGTISGRMNIINGESVFNDESVNVDFRVESNNNANMLFVDAGSDHVSIGTGEDRGGVLNVESSDNNYTVMLSCTDDDNNAGPWLGFDRRTGSAADNDTIGSIAFLGRNSAAEQTSYCEIRNVTTDVTNGTEDGQMQFNIISGGSFRNFLHLTGSAQAVFNEDSHDIDFRVESNSNTHMIFVDGGNDRVGIGASSPASVLHVKGSNDGTFDGVSTLIVEGTEDYNSGDAGGGINFNGRYDSSNNVTTLAQISGMKASTASGEYDGVIKFGVRNDSEGLNIERMRLTHEGYLNIGRTDEMNMGANNVTGINLLGVNGIKVSNSGGPAAHLGRQGSDGEVVKFASQGTADVGSIDCTTSGTTYTTTSDLRLKTDIQPIADGTEKLMAMNPVSHKWIVDPEADAVYGFIAQEMQEIVPEAVSGDPDGEEMMSMDYGRITPVLVAALQDAHNKITALEKRLAELEAK